MSTTYDEAVRASHAEGMARIGGHSGTPVVSVTGAQTGHVAFFGPVVSHVPRGEQATRLWDGILLVAATPGFHVLMGTPHEEPQLDS